MASVASPAAAPAPEVATVVEPPVTTAQTRRARTPRPVEPAIAVAIAAVAADALTDAAPVAAPVPAVVATPRVEPVLTPAEPFELLEPLVADDTAAPTADKVADTEAEPVEAAEAAASDVDEFAAAARLFAFTGEVPLPQPEAAAEQQAPAHDEAPQAEPPVAAPATRRSRVNGRQIATASFSVGVMGIVGLLTVGMTTPTQAVAATTGTDAVNVLLAGTDVTADDVDPDDIQAYVAPSTIEHAALARDETYSSVSLGEIASQLGITNHSDFFVNDSTAAIQWPFAVGVPITSGFGARWGRMHEGVDFVPGEGAEVQAIAEGTVRIATNSGGAYGVTVVIDHIIDGQLVSSRYAHMLVGSLKVSVGDHVNVGTILGNTGNTGRSYGAHTHFEVRPGGTTAVDPIAWLRANAGRHSLG